MENNVTQRVPKSKFNLSHSHKTSLDFGFITPSFCIATMPGDEFKMSQDHFIRGMPTINPIMDRVDIKTNYFYVPYRVVWDQFKNFISKNEDYKVFNEAEPEIPYLSIFQAVGKELSTPYSILIELSSKTGVNIEEYEQEYQINKEYPFGLLCDYLGLTPPSSVENNLSVSGSMHMNLVPLLAYQHIYIEYFAPQRWISYLTEKGEVHPLMRLKRFLHKIKYSQNYGLSIGVDFSNMSVEEIKDFLELFKLRKVYWNQDYINNALPTPTIHGDSKVNIITAELPDNKRNFETSAGALIEFSLSGRYASQNRVDNNNSVLATVRDLRKSISMQHFYELLTNSGGRYLETMEVMYNEFLPTSILQLPEYIGGSVNPIVVSEVEATAGTEQTALGDLGGKPLGASKTETFKFRASEFGFVFVLNHIVPKRSYTNRVERHFVNFSFDDFPNVVFEGIGDQPLYNYEVGLLDNSNKDFDPFGIFGYTPRYSEWKTCLDRYSGEMSRSLMDWHLGDVIDYEDISKGIRPEFFEANVREDIFNVPSERGKFLGVFHLNCSVKRGLSYNSPLGVNRV